MGRWKWNVWPGEIISVDPETRTVVASWNGNKPKTTPERWVTKYRARRPKDD